VVPRYSHQPSKGSALFSIFDQLAQAALDIWREDKNPAWGAGIRRSDDGVSAVTPL
jgi:hypothetical protein